MDATLLRDDKSYDEERFNQVYRKLQEMGVQVVIASGNNVSKLNEYLDHMDTETIYFAGDNGNYLVKNGEVLQKTAIEPQDTVETFHTLKDLGDFDIMMSDGDRNYSDYIREENKEAVHVYYRKIYPVEDIQEVAQKGIVKIACYTRRSLDEAKAATEKIIKKTPGVDAVTSGYNWIDIYHVDGGKGHAVEAIQEKYGITAAETMAFGDSLNDASMMAHAAYRVAMGNGDPEFKELANYEIGTHEEQAVIDVLEEFVETGQLDFMKKYER